MLDLTNPKDAHTDERLRKDPIIWLSSVRPDGRPHLVPVWFLWYGETILIFSQPNAQKIRNLRQNTNVILALDDTKDGDDVVMLEGKAELLNDPAVNPTLPAYVAKYDSQLKSMGYTAEAMAAEYTQAIRITPTRFLNISG
jgi:PPOX class probable F420-dependent enzyme